VPSRSALAESPPSPSSLPQAAPSLPPPTLLPDPSAATRELHTLQTLVHRLAIDLHVMRMESREVAARLDSVQVSLSEDTRWRRRRRILLYSSS
jgi:hypothetical protein